MTAYRNVAALILAVMLLQAAAGVLSVSTPLALKAMGANSLGVGLVASVFSAGFMLGAWWSPRIVRNMGHIRAYAAAAAIYAAGILGMSLLFDATAWGPLRFIQGAASAVMFTAAESWIADSTPKVRRGAVMGLYQVLIKIAMACGPLLVVDHAPEDAKPFVLSGLLMVLALVPICLTQRAQPAPPDRAPFNFGAVLRVPPAALAGALAAGIGNTGVMSQLPLYAAELRPESPQAAAAALSIAAWMGGVVTQWPAGILSDRTDRRFVVAALAALSAGAALAIFLTTGRITWTGTVALAAVWGGGALSYYSICAAHATDRTDPGRVTEVLSAMLFVWAAGSVAGPVIAGLVADTPLGLQGVFIFAAVVHVLLVAANLGRMLARPGGDRRSNFAGVGATSVIGAEVAEGADPAKPRA